MDTIMVHQTELIVCLVLCYVVHHKVTVQRELNPKRREGHVFPWLGKLAPFSTRILDRWLEALDKQFCLQNK